MNLSWAGNLEDVVLRRALTNAQGQYVDVGANRHQSGSVTYWCDERGWEGLCIEPQRELARALASARARAEVFVGCVSDRVGQSEMWIDSADPALSTMDRDQIRRYKENGRSGCSAMVEVSTLNDLLMGSAIRPGFDLLKVDAEGHEMEVLQGIDLGVWRPRVVVVEAVAPYEFKMTHHKWDGLLQEAGYIFCLFDGVNRFYAAADESELVERLSWPACALDEYVPARYARAVELEEFGRLALWVGLRSASIVQACVSGIRGVFGR